MKVIMVPDELAPRGPVDATPARRPGTVRRTTTIDMTWTGGLDGRVTLAGRGRDLRTTSEDLEPSVLAEETTRVVVEQDRTISEIVITDLRDARGVARSVPDLVGARAGFGFRGVVAERTPQLIAAGTPSSLLLDDTPGAALISGWAFGRWLDLPLLLEKAKAAGAPQRNMEGVCTGFQAGSSGLNPDGTSRWNHNSRPVRSLDRTTDDPWAWHDFADVSGQTAMRRTRRIDVWRAGTSVEVDSFFQDSSTTPAGGREAVHEYQLLVGAREGVLERVDAVPRVLPYRECPLATQQVDQLLGTPLADLRSVVLERLKGIAGCTHLNDALRALADVPHLVAHLPG